VTDILMPPDLFAAAGVELEDVPAPVKPKRPRKPKPPTPAERATQARAQAVRRERRPDPNGERVRIGSARDLSPRKVFAYPLSRNTGLLDDMVKRLPHGYDDSLDKQRASEAKKLERRLLNKGLPAEVSWQCANELVHVAYMRRVHEAHEEAGIL